MNLGETWSCQSRRIFEDKRCPHSYWHVVWQWISVIANFRHLLSIQVLFNTSLVHSSQKKKKTLVPLNACFWMNRTRELNNSNRCDITEQGLPTVFSSIMIQMSVANKINFEEHHIAARTILFGSFTFLSLKCIQFSPFCFFQNHVKL